MTGRRRRNASLAALALLGACAWPSAAPLPDWRAVAGESRARAGQLRVAVGALDHPMLRSVPVDPDDGLDPDEAAVLAVLLSPDLAAARAARGEAEAALLAAGLLPNPTFDVEAAHPYGSHRSGEASPVKLALSLDTSDLVTRAARTAAASARVQEIDLGLAWREWQIAQAARLQTVRLAGLRRRLPLARARVEDEQGLVAALAPVVQRGDLPLTTATSQAERVQAARAVERELESAEAAARHALVSLLGLPPETELVVSPGATAIEGAGSDDAFATCYARRLDLAALRAGYDAQEATLRQSVLEQLPRVSVGVTHERNDSRVTFLGGMVSLGLPVFDRGQARVALAEATRERLRLEYQARVASAREELGATLDELQRIEAARARLAADMPSTEALWRAQRTAAARGDLDRVAEALAHAAELALSLELESLVQARDELGVALETACGGSLGSAGARS